MLGTKYRRTGRGLVLALSLTVVMALGSGTASAETGLIAVEESTGIPCSELTVEGNDVSGGCLNPGWSGQFGILQSPTVLFDTCAGSFDVRVGPEAEVQAVDQDVQCNWPRKACEDEVAGETLPWAGEFRVTSPGVFEAEIDMCLEHSTGGAHYWVTIPYDLQLQGGSVPASIDQVEPAFVYPGGPGIAGAEFDTGQGGVALIEL